MVEYGKLKARALRGRGEDKDINIVNETVTPTLVFEYTAVIQSNNPKM
jgi:hypothetical protein